MYICVYGNPSIYVWVRFDFSIISIIVTKHGQTECKSCGIESNPFCILVILIFRWFITPIGSEPNAMNSGASDLLLLT